MVYRTTVLLAAFLATAGILLTTMDTPAAQWHEGGKTILSPATETMLEEHALRLRATGPVGGRQSLTFALPVGKGDLGLDVLDAALRSSRTGETVRLSGLEGEEKARFHDLLLKNLTLEDYGYLRRLRTARLVAGNSGRLAWEDGGWEWAEIDVRVSWEENPKTRTSDPHMESGPWRDLLEDIVVHPEAISLLAHTPPLNEKVGPTAWQPDPDAAGPGGWHAIPVTESDLYVIDRLWLEEAGIDPGNLHPAAVGIFHGGRPVPVTLLTPEDRGFAMGGRLAFKGLENTSSETRENVYFMRALGDDETQLRMKSGGETKEGAEELLRHRAAQVIDKDATFKTRLGSFLSIRQMNWVGSELTAGEPHTLDFDLPSLNAGPGGKGMVHGELLLYADDEHQPQVEVEVRHGGKTLASARVTASRNTLPFTIPAGDLSEWGNAVEFLLAESDSRGGRSRGLYIDKVSLEWPALLEGRAGRLEVDFSRDPSFKGGMHTLRTVGFNPARLLALDLTKKDAPIVLPVRRDRANALVDARLSPSSRLLLAETTAIRRAPLPRAVHWIDLAQSTGPSDVLIIHHGMFGEPAGLLLGNLRESGIASRAIPLEAVYNAFSHGHLSPAGIRRFISHAVYHWEHPPHGVILIGDGNVDGRGVARNNVPNLLPVPLMAAGRRGDSGEAFSTDAWYSWLSEGDELADLYVSRLPFASVGDAMAAVHNIINHRALQDDPQPWADRIVTIADTGSFKSAVEEIDDDSVARGFRSDFIFADDHPWEDNYYLPAHLLEREEDAKISPTVTAAIEAAFNEGAGVVSFLGHGAPNLWSNQRFWFGGGTPNSDIPNLANQGRLPFVVSYTCSNAVIDYPLEPWNICIAEDFLRHRDRGAIACFMPSGPGYLRDHQVLARTFNDALTRLGATHFGHLAELSRAGHQFLRAQDDQARMFLLLGDLTLSLPPAPRDRPREPKPREKEFIASGEDTLITSFRRIDGGDPSPLETRWLAIVANNLQEETTAPWRLRLHDEEGTLAGESHGEVIIPARSSIQLPLSMKVPREGFYLLELEIPHSSGAWYGGQLPGRIVREGFAAGEIHRASPYVPPSSLKFTSLARGTNPRRLSCSVVNPTGEAVETFLVMEVVKDGEVVDKTERMTGRIASGQFSTHSLTVPAASLVDQPVTFRVRLHEGRGADGALLDEAALMIDPREDLPDLVVDEDSIEVLPPTLSDGLTVFVEALVRNEGKATSPEVEAGLYRPEDSGFNDPLRDMTQRRNLTTIAPLHPGEERRVRLRWDPFRNAGNYDLLLVIDPLGAAFEPNRENNVATVNLDVKTKWDLVTGSIRVARSEAPNTLLLVAQVGNSGETDARQVTVNFYRSREQGKESLLGEKLLDRVPGESLETVIFEWEVSAEDLETTTFDPSFSIALKGSQRRVSSITEEE